MLDVIMLNVVILDVITLNVITLNVITLNVVMLSVMGPQKYSSLFLCISLLFFFPSLFTSFSPSPFLSISSSLLLGLSVSHFLSLSSFPLSHFILFLSAMTLNQICCCYIHLFVNSHKL
jgi:hypothetical protein